MGAIVRLLSAYGHKRFVPPLYRLLRNPGAARDQELHEQVLDRCAPARVRYGRALPVRGTTLAEYSFAPFFEGWCIVEHYRNFEVPDTLTRRELAPNRPASTCC